MTNEFDNSINTGDVNNLTKFREIMESYRNGEYGSKHLSLDELLVRAGEKDLLRQLSLEELDELINDSFGISKEAFIMIKNELTLKNKNESALARPVLIKSVNTNIGHK